MYGLQGAGNIPPVNGKTELGLHPGFAHAEKPTINPPGRWVRFARVAGRSRVGATPNLRARQFILAGFLPLFLPIGDCAHAQQLPCTGTQKPQLVAELMFGRKIVDRTAVTEEEWENFVDQEITPRFPGGLTVLSGQAQWRDGASSEIVREPSKMVVIVLPGKPEDVARINEIAQVYKSRFKQQSVGVILRGACVSF